MTDFPDMPKGRFVVDVAQQDYYQVLRLSPAASKLDVINAYRRAKLAFRADSLAVYSLYGKDDLEKIRKQIDQAYAVLSDHEQRQVYDVKRGFVAPRCDNDGKIEAETVQDDVTDIGAADGSAGDNVVDLRTKQHLRCDPDPELERRIKAADAYPGDFLREVRESRGVSLRDIAAFTRISIGYLQAIEAEDAACLPAVAYLKGYLAQYAAEIGLEPHRVVQGYPPLAD